MDRFLLTSFCLYLILCPFYFFPSGLPQIADAILAVGIIVFIVSGKMREMAGLRIFKWGFRLVLLIVVVQTAYWFFYYALRGVQNQMYFVGLFYIYNILALGVFLHILNARPRYNHYISVSILLSLTIQAILAFFNISGASSETGVRSTLFFNNPNQLGYFSLLMFSLFAILPNPLKKNLLVLLYATFLSSYLILLSGSRSALAGIAILSILIYIKEGLKLNLMSMLILVGLGIFISSVYKTNFIQERIHSLEQRGQRQEHTNVTEAQVRGYDRLYLYPQYIVFGAGEGLNDRFESYHQLEIHSGFATILFSYGLIGFILFVVILAESMRGNFFESLLLLLPVFLYNLTHQGVRESLFWLVIGGVYYLNNYRRFHTSALI